MDSFFGNVRGGNLNRYSHFAPRIDWIRQFLELKDNFFTKNNLGSVMVRFFKRFLLDADLIYKNCLCSSTTDKICKLGIDSNLAWGIIVVNLSIGSPLVRWYFRRVIFDENYSKLCLLKMIEDYGSKGGPDIVSALAQMCNLPLGNIGFGKCIYNRKNFASITRHKWEEPSDLIVLYSLYKFAEVSGWQYGFKFEKLFDNSEAEVVSPVQIFGIDEKSMSNIINGLAVNYPDFISAAFSLDIQSVKLNPLKNSMDVLELIA